VHLGAAELIDLAEGTRGLHELPHAAACARCRREVESLRATMAAAAGADVPEPSPLFWDHLSRRVREAVAAEKAPARGRRWPWPIFVPAAAAAALLVAALLLPDRNPAGGGFAHPSEPSASGPGSFSLADPLVPEEDASYALIRDLAADLDWETAVEAGLTAPDLAFGHLAGALEPAEQLELQRLLQAELSSNGA
jgi:hypothetical protein